MSDRVLSDIAVSANKDTTHPRILLNQTLDVITCDISERIGCNIYHGNSPIDIFPSHFAKAITATQLRFSQMWLQVRRKRRSCRPRGFKFRHDASAFVSVDQRDRSPLQQALAPV